jgi:hypothetical protein
MEKIIRILKLRGEVYISRTDVLSLIKDMASTAESLNAKEDMKSLIRILSEGIEDHKNGT